jgi:microcystin degradation protein MlrC
MKRLRIAILRIMHESNCFSPLRPDLAHFRTIEGVQVGQDLLAPSQRMDEITGFLEVLSSVREVEVVPLLNASGFAGGNVTEEVVTYLEETLRRLLRDAGKLDAILVALHGAMASDRIDDLESYFLEILRQEKGSVIPIVCTLDCHAVVTQKMMDLTSAMTAYKTHPHIDIVETGRRGAQILLRMLTGEIKPVMAWKKIPMMLPPPDDGTRSGPMKELFDTVIRYSEQKGVIDCCVYCCMAWLDVPEQGWAALAITDNDLNLAGQIAKDLANRAWKNREGFLPDKMFPPRQAVRLAAKVEGCPVLIVDSADTTGAGAPGDTTTLLQALLDERNTVPGLILHSLPDPQAIEKITPSNVGTTVTLTVGGKRDTRFCRPVTVRGKVLCITDGMIEDVGKFTSLPMIDAGKTVCLAIDNLRLVITERIVIGPQPSLYRKVGIEPFEAKIVALKTGVGYKPTYGHVAKAVIRADCPGAASYNLSNYTFSSIPRPMYPLDKECRYEP